MKIMDNIRTKYYVALLLVITMLSSCNDFLEVKYDKRLVVPTTINDMRSLLDRTILFNENTPNIGEISSGDFYTIYDRWQALPAPDHNVYIWAKDVFENAHSIDDWNRSYERIYYVNVVLDELKELDITKDDQEEYYAIEGAARYFRAVSLFQLMQLFAEQYDPLSASTNLGVPIRLESDINSKVSRSTVEETYQQILKDLNVSTEYLRESEPVKTRPTKAAAHAFLAKVLLQMGDYENARDHASECLSFDLELLDYNDVDLSARYPFERLNKEVIIHSTMIGAIVFTAGYLRVDDNLLKTYDESDLRKEGYFFDNGGFTTYKGSYNSSPVLFNGITVPEVLLIRAECNVRLGNPEPALDDLNRLLEKRTKKEQFTPVKIDNVDDLLRKVLLERRKELLFRGIRWSDIRRLNVLDNANISLIREFDNARYELKVGSSNFVFPIPDDAIKLGKYQQNPERQ